MPFNVRCSNKVLLGTIIASTMLFPAASHAGFEWVPAKTNAASGSINTPPAQIAVQEAPVAEVTGVPLDDEAQVLRVPPTMNHMPAQQAASAAPAAPAKPAIQHLVMTPSPFDAPAEEVAPQQVAPQQASIIPAAEDVLIPATTIETAPIVNAATESSVEESSDILNAVDSAAAAIQETAQQASAPVDLVPVQDSAQAQTAPISLTEQALAQTGEASPSAPTALIPAQQEPVMIAPAQQIVEIQEPAQQDTTPVSALASSDMPTEIVHVSADAQQAETAPAVIETAAPAAENYEIAVGFGKEMPLALAVQQIIPVGYAYSFSKSVNPGQAVSWNGGRTWNVVLQETLEPLGLEARISGNTIVIVQEISPLAAMATNVAQQPESISAENTQTETVQVAADVNAVSAIEPASGVEGAEKTAPRLLDTSIMPAEQQVKIDGTAVQNTATRHTISDPGESPSQQPQAEVIPLSPKSEVTAEGVAAPIEATTASLQPKANDVLVIVPEIKTEEERISAPVDMNAGQSWTASKGESVKKVLYSWGRKANMEVIWEAAYDYTLEQDFMVSGSLKQAVSELVQSASAQGSAPTVRFIGGNQAEKNAALVIIQDPEAAPAVATTAAPAAISAKPETIIPAVPAVQPQQDPLKEAEAAAATSTTASPVETTTGTAG